MSLSILKLVLLCFFASVGLAQGDPGISVYKSEFIGNITGNSQVIRDLGFHGQIGKMALNSYGDTFYCSRLDKNDRSGCTLPLAANSVSISSPWPLEVIDFNLHGKQQVPYQFCPYVPAWGEDDAGKWGLGITNIVEIAENTGILFFARNFRPPGETHILGSGVAVVDISGAYPTCTRHDAQWWDGSKEPIYGDHGAVDGQDGYIYAFGQFGAAMKLYLTRVARANALDLNAYEYWNGDEFSKNRLYNPGEKEVVLSDTNQGSFFWSPHFNKWMSLTRSRWDMVALTLRTADKLQGPWSDETTVFRAPKIFDGNLVYAPTHHPHFDDTGKSLVVSYTQDHNIQQAARIIFN